jgi:hypothetical protein
MSYHILIDFTKFDDEYHHDFSTGFIVSSKIYNGVNFGNGSIYRDYLIAYNDGEILLKTDYETNRKKLKLHIGKIQKLILETLFHTRVETAFSTSFNNKHALFEVIKTPIKLDEQNSQLIIKFESSKTKEQGDQMLKLSCKVYDDYILAKIVQYEQTYNSQYEQTYNSRYLDVNVTIG